MVQDPLGDSDLILVMNGDVHVRPFRAADLYRQGVAPIVGVTEVEMSPAVQLGVYPSTTTATIQVLRRRGVPPHAIRVLPVPGGAASTTEEALALRHYAERHSLRRVTIVTTSYHTRRTRWTFRRVFRGRPVEIRLASVEDDRFTMVNWWRSEVGLISVFQEYIKFVYHAVSRRGGSFPREG